MKETVLLTGGAGFIGSHIAVELLQRDYNVGIADDLSNARPDVPERIRQITGRAPAFYHMDAADRPALDRVFREHPIAAAVHLAGYKAVGESVQKPLAYYRNNLDTTLALLDVMADHGVHRLIFSSSATVYGDAPAPCREDMPTGGCTNPYAWTKLMIEQILAVTIGMAEILGAKKIRLGVFRDWHRSVIRQTAYGEVSAHFPATLIQRHLDAMIIVNANAAKQPF